jgi:hypothetical protein
MQPDLLASRRIELTAMKTGRHASCRAPKPCPLTKFARWLKGAELPDRSSPSCVATPPETVVMLLINIYASEMLSAMRGAITQDGSTRRIWGDYAFHLHSGAHGGALRLQKSVLDPLAEMTLSRDARFNRATTYFSRLHTTKGYEKQGIGALIVGLGVMFAMAHGDGFLALGESDTSGSNFWKNKGLSEAPAQVGTVLRKMMQEQADLAAKLGQTIDSSAFLVALHPTPVRNVGGARRRGSFG